MKSAKVGHGDPGAGDVVYLVNRSRVGATSSRLMIGGLAPKVAAGRQPWAGGRNSFGIFGGGSRKDAKTPRLLGKV